jgi:hypothetical protein
MADKMLDGSLPVEWDDEVQAFVRPIAYRDLKNPDGWIFYVAWDGERWSKAHYSRLFEEMIQREWNETP